MRISDWSSDVCSSDLGQRHGLTSPHDDVTGRPSDAGEHVAQAGSTPTGIAVGPEHLGQLVAVHTSAAHREALHYVGRHPHRPSHVLTASVEVRKSTRLNSSH